MKEYTCWTMVTSFSRLMVCPKATLRMEISQTPSRPVASDSVHLLFGYVHTNVRLICVFACKGIKRGFMYWVF